jgi:hypothetical protein
VSISCRDTGDAWLFEVEDDGIGIEPRNQERIFKMFQRLKPEGQGSGTGLGLSLVKKMVEQQGGTVSLRSTPGRGSTFGFTIPKRGPPRSAANHAEGDGPADRSRRDSGMAGSGGVALPAKGAAAAGSDEGNRSGEGEGDAHLSH